MSGLINMDETVKIKRNVKRFIRDIQARTKKMPELDRLEQYFEVGVALGNAYKVSEIMTRLVDMSWAAKQSSKSLIETQRALADAYVKLAGVYITLVDSNKEKFLVPPEEDNNNVRPPDARLIG